MFPDCWDRFFRESVEGRFVPNNGFLEDVVYPDPSFLASMASHSCEGDDCIDKTNDNEEKVDPTTMDITCSEHDPSSSFHLDNKNDNPEQIVSELDGLKVVENDELRSEDQPSLSVEDVDVLLDKCLLQALHTMVKDRDLPMPGSTLW